MRIETVRGIQLSLSPAIDAYLTDFARVAAAYQYDPFRSESYEERAAFLNGGGFGGDRQGLAAALERYNRALGADEAALANARLLGEEGSLVAVTGQQAGIFTGPAYTIYKAITVIHLARRESRRLGRPVVPLFWIAGEDHDWQEIGSVMVPAGDSTQRVALKEPLDRERRSVAMAPLPGSLVEVLDQFEQLMPETEFKTEVMAQLRQAAVGEPALDPAVTDGQPTLSDWFGRLMAWLFRSTGLVLMDAADPALRRLEAPFLARAIERYEQVDEALARGIGRWEQELGFKATVERQPGSLNLFLYVDGARLPLVGQGDRIWVRSDETLTWSRQQLIDLALTHPERFSTNVVLRPVIQGALLPDLAYVGGPGEISYWGLYREVFQVMEQQMPVVLPREGFTLVEPPLARILEKQNLPLSDVFHCLDERKAELLEREDRLGIAQLFTGFREDFRERYAGLADSLLQLDQQLGHVIEENRRQIEHQLNRLEEKAKQQHRKNCDTTVRQFERLKGHLIPGGLQERSVSILPYVVKYGPGLVGRLVDEVPLEERWTHRAIYLGD